MKKGPTPINVTASGPLVVFNIGGCLEEVVTLAQPLMENSRIELTP